MHGRQCLLSRHRSGGLGVTGSGIWPSWPSIALQHSQLTAIVRAATVRALIFQQSQSE